MWLHYKYFASWKALSDSEVLRVSYIQPTQIMFLGQMFHTDYFSDIALSLHADYSLIYHKLVVLWFFEDEGKFC